MSAAIQHCACCRISKKHHEGSWSLREGVCECECSLCWVNDDCRCPDCTDPHHDHSRRAL